MCEKEFYCSDYFLELADLLVDHSLAPHTPKHLESGWGIIWSERSTKNKKNLQITKIQYVHNIVLWLWKCFGIKCFKRLEFWAVTFLCGLQIQNTKNSFLFPCRMHWKYSGSEYFLCGGFKKMPKACKRLQRIQTEENQRAASDNSRWMTAVFLYAGKKFLKILFHT